jgi:hypothetical protein
MGYWFCPRMTAIDAYSPYALEYSLFTARLLQLCSAAEPAVEEFHKTTFQNPPVGGLISEGATAYRDPDTARRAFDDLVGLVSGCGAAPLGPMFVGRVHGDH